jgi:hypothetical protein
MFEDEGYAVESISGINAFQGDPNVSRRLWWTYRLVNAVFLGKFVDMRFQQFAVVAHLSHCDI